MPRGNSELKAQRSGIIIISESCILSPELRAKARSFFSRRYLSLIGTLLLLPALSQAADRYWIATGAATNWNSTANWSTTSGGSSGASVPVNGDGVFFDGAGKANCNI